MEVRDEVVDRVPVGRAWADSMEGATLAVRADGSWGLSTNEGEERARKELAAHGREGIFRRERVASEVAVRGYHMHLDSRYLLRTRIRVDGSGLRSRRFEWEGVEQKRFNDPEQDDHRQRERAPASP